MTTGRSQTTEGSNTYAKRGVSSGKEELHNIVAKMDKGLFPGAFCHILPDMAGDEAYVSLLHADGVGTKSLLAYLMWREGIGTAEELFAATAWDACVMNLNDLAAVGALGPFYISNTVDRNARKIPGEVLRGLLRGFEKTCDLHRTMGIPCVMAGGETADLGDAVRTMTVNVTVATRMEKEKVINAARIQVGDALVGFFSHGQSAWETAPNSGIMSNGLTDARHDTLRPSYRHQYGETYAPETDFNLVYKGKYRLTDELPGDGRFTIGSALLSPTRSFAPLVKELTETVGQADIHALIHCSGGGQTKIGRFGRLGLAFDITSPATPPAVFQMLKEATGKDAFQMYQVYNMGVGFVAVVPSQVSAVCIRVAQGMGIEAQRIGTVLDGMRVRKDERNEVVITPPWKEGKYTQILCY